MSVASDDAPKAPAKSASTAKKRGLGRGLEALLGPKAAAEAPSLEANGNDTLRNLPIDALTAGKYQPRKHWDEDKLEELAESIKAQGVIQPIVVREVEHRAQQFALGRVPEGKRARPNKAKPQADIVSLERELSESLNTKVNVLHGRAGKGRLVIHYSDLDSLEGVLEKLRSREQ